MINWRTPPFYGLQTRAASRSRLGAVFQRGSGASYLFLLLRKCSHFCAAPRSAARFIRRLRASAPSASFCSSALRVGQKRRPPNEAHFLGFSVLMHAGASLMFVVCTQLVEYRFYHVSVSGIYEVQFATAFLLLHPNNSRIFRSTGATPFLVSSRSPLSKS